MAVTIGFELSYGQLSVFVSSLKDPYNDWTDRHMSQGFTWRPGSVSFSSMVESGRHSVEIHVVNHAAAVHPGAVRAVAVPFEVPADGAIEVGSISETVPLELPPGSFLLRCEFFQPSGTDEDERARLT
ncbi:competence protein ComJ [Bradyrhizobium brasilense]|uniref:competence protein ComJ n=1 Tax=Bradyrhizobium brasilense TaxID=1419277 RepID=UPI0024B0F987|nr:competence protein ComJ [Bradyrhizobium australafricanum]WFU35650.1 competence protein ComJ [Bradyrhizobium australafricanum]